MPKPGNALSDAAQKLVREHTADIVPAMLRDRIVGMKDELFDEFVRRLANDELYNEIADRVQGRIKYFGGSAHVGRIDSSSVDFVQSGIGAIARTVESRLQDSVSVFDFIPVAEHAAIVARTSTTDVSSYIQAAIDTGRSVFMPGGLYSIGTGLTMSVPGQQLIGSGMANDATAKGTQIKASAGINMLLVSSTRCKVADLYLNGNGVALNGTVLHQANTGVVMQVNAQNCTQDGFLFDTAAASPAGSNNTMQCIGCISNQNGGRGFAAPTHQADNGGIQLIGCWAGGNTSHGMLLKGNSWRVYGGVLEGNGGYGIQISESGDASFSHGSVIFYPWVEGNTLGGVRGGGKSVRNVYWLSDVSGMQTLSLESGSEDLQLSANNNNGGYFQVSDGTNVVFLKPNGRQVNAGRVLVAGGDKTSPSYGFGDDLNTGIFQRVADFLMVAIAGVEAVYFTSPSATRGTLNLGGTAGGKLGFSTGALDSISPTAFIEIEANDTLGQRRSINAQVFNHYGTFTNSAFYHRSALKHAKTTLSNVSGATVTATDLIPAGAFLFGVTTRINTGLGAGNGTTGYAVGTAADPNLWGDVAAITAGTASQSADFTAAGAAGLYIAAESVILTAAGGDFDGTGVIEVVAHYMVTEAD